MVGMAGGTKAPQDAVGFAGEVNRTVPFRSVTATATAAALTATVIVGNQIILTISRIVTGTNPGHGSGFCSRRALGDGATTTAAYSSAECAVAPVVTRLRISHIGDTV